MKNIFLVILLILTFSNLSAQKIFPPLEKDEKAFDGYDLISFFNGKIEEGNKDIFIKHQGITLYFSTIEHKNEFAQDPEKYYPEYNGWCAIGLAKGILRKPDYRQFKIQDNQVLFFEVKAFYNGKTDWNKNPEANKIVADDYYVKLVIADK